MAESGDPRPPRRAKYRISSSSALVSSKKTQYEEFMDQTEEQRFELDIDIELNRSAIQVLESVQTHLMHVPLEEAIRFQLGDSLQVLSPQPQLEGMSPAEAEKFRELSSFKKTSQVLPQRAIRRIFGDSAEHIIDGLKRNPLVYVPLVLKRMKAEDEEWRKEREDSNQKWRQRTDILFRQSDLKAIKPQSLINQIETLYEKRREMLNAGFASVRIGPHMEIVYPDERAAFYDVTDLLIHHVNSQRMQKEEKSKIKKILKVILPGLFGLDPAELSDDKDGGDDDTERCASPITPQIGTSNASESSGQRTESGDKSSCGYSLMFFPNPWYVFLRLHHLLCERLARLRGHAIHLSSEHQQNVDSGSEKTSAAEAIRCRPKVPCSPSEYYPMLLQLIKKVLDGQIDNKQYESSLRDMFTMFASMAFTMDQLVKTMVKQLRVMVKEEFCVKSMALYEKWCVAGRLAYGSVNRRDNEEAYQREAEQLMVDQNCFKSCFCHEKCDEYDKCKITFEILNTDSDSNEPPDTAEKSDRLVMDDQDDIVSSPFTELLPKPSDAAVDSSTKMQGRSGLVKLCKDVFDGQSTDGPVSCQHSGCGKALMLYNKHHDCWRTDMIIEHATSHVEKPLFKCGHCDYTTKTERCVKKHLMKCNDGKIEKGIDYMDLSDAYEDKIKESIIRCFQKGSSESQPGSTSEQITIQMENKIRGHISGGSQLKNQRHLHVNRLFKQAEGKDGEVICSVCSESFNKSTKPSRALHHVEVHLKKPLYQCTICQETFATRGLVGLHATDDHHVSAAGSYEDQSDQFHAEIMAMVLECFVIDSDVQDPDRVDQIVQCVKQAFPSISNNVQSAKFLTFLIDKLIPVLPKICGDNADNTRLELLRLTADLSTYCGELQEPEAKIDAVENALMSHLPVPPSESGGQPEDGAAGDSDEPKLQFSEIECLIYTLHQLGRRFPQHLSSPEKSESLKELRERLQYLDRVIQVYSTKLKQALKKTPKKELKSDVNRIKQVALKTASNISVLLKDLLHVPPSYKATVGLSWKATE